MSSTTVFNKMTFNQFNIVWESTGADCVDNISQYNAMCWSDIA